MVYTRQGADWLRTTPRLILSELESARYASVMPRMGSCKGASVVVVVLSCAVAVDE